MAQTHRDILNNFKALNWKHAGSDKGVCKFSLLDENNNTIVTDTLLSLKEKGHDIAIIEKQYKETIL